MIYEALVEGRLEAPKHLVRSVHDLYCSIRDTRTSRPRTIWSLSNAFTSTSGFKELETISQFKVTAKLGEFLEAGSHNCSSLRGGLGQPAPFRRRTNVVLIQCSTRECGGWGSSDDRVLVRSVGRSAAHVRQVLLL